jgi:hypothetical protein
VPTRTKLFAGAFVYGVLVFLGTAGLGFVVLPIIGYHSGLFPIETEADAAFSLTTLKAVPLLAGFSAATAVSYEWLTSLPIARRIAIYLATTLLVWITAAAIAAFLLG